MNKLNKIKSIIREKPFFMLVFKFVKKIGIKLFYLETLKAKFKDSCGYYPDLKNPETFCEKIQWIKLNLHDPLMTQCADKYAVREYLEQNGGGQYLNDIYGVWDDPSLIDFKKLPSNCVFKANHSCGTILFKRENESFDEKAAVATFKKWLKENYFYVTGEWVYKNIKPKIICEKLLGDNLINYKFFCFNGEPKFLYISKDGKEEANDLFLNVLSLDWNLTPFQRNDQLSFPEIPPKPENFNEMVKLAKKLSEPFPFVRVDLYSEDNKIYFGELTFYPTGGFAPFEPAEYEKIIGEYIKLPILN